MTPHGGGGTPAGICLAAGASSRMGSPKALLPFGGKPALSLVAAALESGGCSPIVVVLGPDADEVLGSVALAGEIEVTINDRAAAGRTGSLKAGIAAAPYSPAYVVFPVDHPLANRDDVAALVAEWRRSEAPVVRPVRDGKGGHPILLDGSLREEILALGDDEPLRDLVHRHRDREARVPGSPGTLVNVDTEEEYRRALRALRE